MAKTKNKKKIKVKTPKVYHEEGAPLSTRRYDWDALKLEFMQGPWMTVTSFCREKGMPTYKKSSQVAKMTNGWIEEKKNFMAVATEEAMIQIAEEKVDEIKEAKERQLRIAKKLQEVGEKALDSIEPTEIATIEEIRKLIATGMQEERSIIEAADKSKKGGAGGKLTQVNFNFPENTLTKIIDEADAGELLRLAGKIKQSRARRSGEDAVDEGEGED